MDNIEVKIGDRVFWIEIPSIQNYMSFDGNLEIKSGIILDYNKINDIQSEVRIDSPDGTITRVIPVSGHPTFAKESDAVKVANNILDYYYQFYTNAIKSLQKEIVKNEIRIKDMDKAIERFNRRYIHERAN